MEVVRCIKKKNNNNHNNNNNPSFSFVFIAIIKRTLGYDSVQRR